MPSKYDQEHVSQYGTMRDSNVNLRFVFAFLRNEISIM